MVMEQSDLCVKNATVGHLPTTIDVETKCTTEKNVMHVSEGHHHQPSALLRGNVLDTTNRHTAKCVASLHNILINWMFIILMAT
jgi:hypothetical protein